MHKVKKERIEEKNHDKRRNKRSKKRTVEDSEDDTSLPSDSMEFVADDIAQSWGMQRDDTDHILPAGVQSISSSSIELSRNSQEFKVLNEKVDDLKNDLLDLKSELKEFRGEVGKMFQSLENLITKSGAFQSLTLSSNTASGIDKYIAEVMKAYIYRYVIAGNIFLADNALCDGFKRHLKRLQIQYEAKPQLSSKEEKLLNSIKRAFNTPLPEFDCFIITKKTKIASNLGSKFRANLKLLIPRMTEDEQKCFNELYKIQKGKGVHSYQEEQDFQCWFNANRDLLFNLQQNILNNGPRSLFGIKIWRSFLVCCFEEKLDAQTRILQDTEPHVETWGLLYIMFLLDGKRNVPIKNPPDSLKQLYISLGKVVRIDKEKAEAEEASLQQQEAVNNSLNRFLSKAEAQDHIEVDESGRIKFE